MIIVVLHIYFDQKFFLITILYFLYNTYNTDIQADSKLHFQSFSGGRSGHDFK